MIPESLTLVERQLLINQYQILSKEADYNEREMYQRRIEILEKGYTGLYPKVFNALYEEVPISVYDEIESVLAMYKLINESVRSLTVEERELLQLDLLEFEGFDHNNGMYYHMMSYLVDKMGEHSDYRGRELKSHNPSCMIKYNKMLAIFNKIKVAKGSFYTATHLQEFIDSVANMRQEPGDEVVL
ncbi:YfbU family protein [Dyadobacter sp. CY312]|uniref:YfbU family protein n=1 Tax=Dyadobacter sp. CY312 TaxID=2907303 RepID=UPI001F2A5757|nr:YfbU family protein [Dyadobacter sp. CY312]MCE7041654.1 YfbU family protein [Dyadobacter sp. CY312]